MTRLPADLELATSEAPRPGEHADLRTGAAHLLAHKFIESLGARSGVAFALVLPEGTALKAGTGAPAFTVRFRSDAALVSTLTRGHIGLLEAYFDQDVDVEGDLGAAFAAAMASGFDLQSRLPNRAENALHEWRHSNRSFDQAKANARSHYGLGADFYRLWLDDPLMMYTCGYWQAGTASLEEAQRNKIDHVCRKLRLQATDRFVDVGCGFGGFMVRAHQTTGATGVGVNTTSEQVDWLRKELAVAGLQEKLSVVEADFRESVGPFDKLASIGVLEHAGRDQLGAVVRAHADLLKPGGIGVLHFIGHVGRFETELFIRKHVFPGGWIPSLADVVVEMERSGLEVLDVENLRRHYALTLDEWAARFDRRWAEIHALDPGRFDERFRRIWRSYLIGCAAMFRSPTGYTHLFQIVFSKGNVTEAAYPMCRDHVYRP